MTERSQYGIAGKPLTEQKGNACTRVPRTLKRGLNVAGHIVAWALLA